MHSECECTEQDDNVPNANIISKSIQESLVPTQRFISFRDKLETLFICAKKNHKTEKNQINQKPFL